MKISVNLSGVLEHEVTDVVLLEALHDLAESEQLPDGATILCNDKEQNFSSVYRVTDHGDKRTVAPLLTATH